MNDLLKERYSEKFSFRLRLKSVTYAWCGIKSMLHTEHNSRIHFVFTISALAMGFIFKLSLLEFSALIVVITMVWISELFNTCIEKLIDFVSTEKHPQIKLIKDMGAAAVMLSSISALAVGAIIFIPKIFNHVSFSL
jgi:diacylglycerol kinase